MSAMNQPLLSLDSIKRIRQYVELKFSHLPKEKHAEIVVETIERVVEKQLPLFQSETKQTITRDVIKQTIVTQKRAVMLDDVIEACDRATLTEAESIVYRSWMNEVKREKLSLYGQGQIEQEEKVEQSKSNDEVAVSSVISSDKPVKEKTTFFTPRKKSLYFGFAFCLLFCIIIFSNGFLILEREQMDSTTFLNVTPTPLISLYPLDGLPSNELPSHYQFVEFDKETIKSYLDTRQSILVEEPYFTAIYNTAYDFNIHPVLLFSITGQEQGFVPRDHESAVEIAQNPFNVFYSWQEYNTTIEDTSAIAARTLVNLSKERPAGVDPIKWINRKYAEDENWHKGIDWFFNTIINHQINE